VAVRRGHACIWRGHRTHKVLTLPPDLVCVDVKTDGESPDLNRLGSGVLA
jgi:hypothetical protein